MVGGNHCLGSEEVVSLDTTRSVFEPKAIYVHKVVRAPDSSHETDMSQRLVNFSSKLKSLMPFLEIRIVRYMPCPEETGWGIV